MRRSEVELHVNVNYLGIFEREDERVQVSRRDCFDDSNGSDGAVQLFLVEQLETGDAGRFLLVKLIVNPGEFHVLGGETAVAAQMKHRTSETAMHVSEYKQFAVWETQGEVPFFHFSIFFPSSHVITLHCQRRRRRRFPPNSCPRLILRLRLPP